MLSGKSPGLQEAVRELKEMSLTRRMLCSKGAEG